MNNIREAVPDRTIPRYDAGNADQSTERAPVITTEEARQGETTGRVRLVLRASLGLAIVAAIVLFAIYF